MKNLYSFSIYIILKVFVNLSVLFFIFKFLTTDFFGKNKILLRHKHCAKQENVNPFLDNDLVEHTHGNVKESRTYIHAHKYDQLKNTKYMKLDNTELLDDFDTNSPYEKKYELQLEFIIKAFAVCIVLFSIFCFNYII